MRINVNEAACVGCRICMLACTNRRDGLMRSSRIRIKPRESLRGHVVEVCRQCDERWCVEACPAEAISVNDDTGAVIVDKDACSGCAECAEACPYGAIEMAGDLAQICDLCGGDPICAVGCPVGAIILEEDP